MSNPVEVTVSRNVKVNLGDYESTDFFMSLKMESTRSDAIRVQRELRDLINGALANDIRRHFLKRGIKVKNSLESIKKRYGLI